MSTINLHMKMKHLCKTNRIILNKNFSFLVENRLIPQENITEDNQYEILQKTINPLAHLPYEEQLQYKDQWCNQVVNKLKSLIPKRNNIILNKIVPSPIINKYRNKDEFNIRTGIDGNPKTVGFFYGTVENNDAICIRPKNLINLKESHIAIAQGFENYINNSPLKACHDFQEGHWRTLVVRSNEKGQTMAMIRFHPQDLNENKIQEEIENIKNYYISGEGKSFSPDILYFQICRHTRSINQDSPLMLLFGEPYLTEEIFDLQLRISPDTFFQINSYAARTLYEKCLNLAKIKPYSTVLDLCCGAGIFSLISSSYGRGCIGVDFIPSNIIDSRYNAKINNILNVEFLKGRIEKKFTKIMKNLNLATDIIAFINPGRSGLDICAIKEIIQYQQISKIIYISCMADHPNVLKNIKILNDGGFNLNKIIPIDMFPHSLHTEMIFELVRNY